MEVSCCVTPPTDRIFSISSCRIWRFKSAALKLRIMSLVVCATAFLQQINCSVLTFLLKSIISSSESAFPVSVIRAFSRSFQSWLNTCSFRATRMFMVKSSILAICHKPHAMVSSFPVGMMAYSFCFKSHKRLSTSFLSVPDTTEECSFACICRNRSFERSVSEVFRMMLLNSLCCSLNPRPKYFIFFTPKAELMNPFYFSGNSCNISYMSSPALVHSFLDEFLRSFCLP